MLVETFKTIEIFGVGFGLLYVIGAIAEKWWCWPAGIIGVILYSFSMYHSAMYGESMLQVAYVFVAAYGWINWRASSNQILISNTRYSELVYVLLVSAILSFGFYYLLLCLNGALPFWDAITNGFAIGATYLVARKKIENWIFWVFIDIALSIILFYKGFYFYGVLYIIYTFMAIIGWVKWRQKLLK
jgi:nicotinamide mononucleotide transporter